MRTSRARQSTLTKVTLGLVAIIGLLAAVMTIAGTGEEGIDALLSMWPSFTVAALVYMAGMVSYSISWSLLFESDLPRREVALRFLMSQPTKYLPGGIAQPLGQVVLTAQVIGSSQKAIVALPVHFLINVVVGLSLASPLLLIQEAVPWAGWLMLLTPLLWALLDRRWMLATLRLLGKLHKSLRVESELPAQGLIYRSAAVAVIGHGAMFAAFALIAVNANVRLTFLQAALVYAFAWVVGYVAIPAPAGLGAREAILSALLAGVLTTGDVIAISALHRIITLIAEIALLAIASFAISKQIRVVEETGPDHPVPIESADGH